MRRTFTTFLCALALFAGGASVAQADWFDSLYGTPTLQVRWRFQGTGSEIVAFDSKTDKVFVSNLSAQTIDVLSISDGQLLGSIDVSDLGADAEPTSVAAHDGIVAIAVNLYGVQPATGKVRFVSAKTLAVLSTVDVGYLPDSVVFTPDGKQVVVCNEGEPADDYLTDPQGSISVIRVGNGKNPVVRTAGFQAFDGNEVALRNQGIRIFGPGSSASQDFEPEYATVSEDSKYAFATLQENNAVAKIDLKRARVVAVYPLGTKDHSIAGNGLDASDRDSAINIATYPIRGMYLPDTIGSYEICGKTFLITANEGDARDYDGFAEEVRLGSGSYLLDPTVFPNAAALKASAVLGRLNVTRANGDIDNDGDYDQIHSFGARSFSIWTTTPLGLVQVYDSGDDFEQYLAANSPTFFNVSNDDNTLDSRSDNKGPEPEALAVGCDLGQTFGFIGLERQGGVMLYNVSNPWTPKFIEYRNERDFTQAPTTPAALDSGPEGMAYIERGVAPFHRPALLVANEITGSTVCYEVRRQGGLLSNLLNR